MHSHPLDQISWSHDACGTGLLLAKKARAKSQILSRSLNALAKMAHRGGDIGDSCSDGSGVLFEIPWNLIVQSELSKDSEKSVLLNLNEDQFAHEEQLALLEGLERTKFLGFFFLSEDEVEREKQFELLSDVAKIVGLRIVLKRIVPLNKEFLPSQSLASCPFPVQIIYVPIEEPSSCDRLKFIETVRFGFLGALNSIDFVSLGIRKKPVIVSFSDKIVVYKALVNGAQLRSFYPDLEDKDLLTRFAIFHQRFATNTHPNWELVQPFDHIAHNGEINTIRANTERLLLRLTEYLRDGSLPILPEARAANWLSGEHSDSKVLDLALSFMLVRGFELDGAVSSLICPLDDQSMEAFFQRNLFEVWDGPVALVFTDGENVGACLDRNGLRPLRQIEDESSVGIASEIGVFEFESIEDCISTRLSPGEMVYFSGSIGSRTASEKIQESVMQQVRRFARGYAWAENQSSMQTLYGGSSSKSTEAAPGYFGLFETVSSKQMNELMERASEPLASMGNDAPLALLSASPRSFFDYFRQRFAQVTNPPIDPVRESCLFDMTSYFGGGYVSGAAEKMPFRLSLPCPILLPGAIDSLLHLLSEQDLGVLNFDLDYPRTFGLNAKVDLFCERLDRLVGGIGRSHAVVILSDARVGLERSAFPVLLALAALHSRLVESGTRQSVGLIVHSGQIRSSHDAACLLTLGADAVYPSALFDYCQANPAPNLTTQEAVSNCHKALISGLCKVMSRCGISQFSSYKASYAVDVMGLSHDVCRTWLGLARGRYGRLGLVEIIRENDELFELFFKLEVSGNARYTRLNQLTRWSAFGEKRSYNPDTITALRTAVLRDSAIEYKRYSELLEKQDRAGLTLRGLLSLKDHSEEMPLSQVEPLEEIFSRLSIGAMSIGALSPEAHLTLARAAKQLGLKSNSGEGGESDVCPSSIRQVASGRFGVTLDYLSQATELQIKIAQGAKPGEGGQLPAAKVTLEIAKLRHTQKGVGLISPPPHHDIYSIEDLKQLITDLKRANPRARIGVKLVSSCGIGHIAVGVAKAGADTITVSGHDGGTGAAALNSICHVGEPWEIGLIDVHDELNANGLRHKVRIVVDGQIRTARDVIFASVLGADEFSLATAPLVSLGCMLMRKCHLNTCPVGIATQDERLRGEFSGETIHVVRFFHFLGEEIRIKLSKLGVRSLGELRAKRNLLGIDTSKIAGHWKTRRVDIRQLLFATMTPYSKPKVQLNSLDTSGLAEVQIIENLKQRIAEGTQGSYFLDTALQNTDLTFGTALSAYLHSLGEAFGGRVRVNCSGTAGQSFGAFLISKIDLILTGTANDGVGKGLSGGQIIIRSPFHRSKESVQSLVGNACFYGATEGRAYIAGQAGDRFAVRNSGALLVVEGVGDHGCEYMTGGQVLILGKAGKNLCAGMTGGSVYLFESIERSGAEGVNGTDGANGALQVSGDAQVISQLSESERTEILQLVRDHVTLAQSNFALQILENWNEQKYKLRKVVPSSGLLT